MRVVTQCATLSFLFNIFPSFSCLKKGYIEGILALLTPEMEPRSPKDLPHISLTKKLMKIHHTSLRCKCPGPENLQTLKPMRTSWKICPADEDNLQLLLWKEVGECGKCVGEWERVEGEGWRGNFSSRVNCFSCTLWAAQALFAHEWYLLLVQKGREWRRYSVCASLNSIMLCS